MAKNKLKIFPDAFKYEDLENKLSGLTAMAGYSFTKRDNPNEFNRMLDLLPPGYVAKQQDNLESIDFILDIDGVEFSANFSKSGLKLINKATNKQVKPLWTDKELKYRNFNQTEKKTDNEWMKTQVQLKLESYVNRFKQLI